MFLLWDTFPVADSLPPGDTKMNYKTWFQPSHEPSSTIGISKPAGAQDGKPEENPHPKPLADSEQLRVQWQQLSWKESSMVVLFDWLGGRGTYLEEGSVCCGNRGGWDFLLSCFWNPMCCSICFLLNLYLVTWVTILKITRCSIKPLLNSNHPVLKTSIAIVLVFVLCHFAFVVFQVCFLLDFSIFFFFLIKIKNRPNFMILTF